jgi:4-aminobutyrate aminotransferase/(S)-3-amino-2-methylpropionate transaminase
MDAAIPGSLGTTFGGNPVSVAAAHAVLDRLERGDLAAGAERIARAMGERAARWTERFPRVGEVRGLGAMWGIELVQDRVSKAPARDEAGAVTRACRERGLVVLTAGTLGNVIRTLMPLVITDEELAEGLDVLESALAAA